MSTYTTYDPVESSRIPTSLQVQNVLVKKLLERNQLHESIPLLHTGRSVRKHPSVVPLRRQCDPRRRCSDLARSVAQKRPSPLGDENPPPLATCAMRATEEAPAAPELGGVDPQKDPVGI